MRIDTKLTTDLKIEVALYTLENLNYKLELENLNFKLKLKKYSSSIT